MAVPPQAPTAPHGARARIEPEIAAVVRLAVLLGLVGVFGPFALVLLKLQIYSLALPTGSLPTAWGLVVGFCIAAAGVVALGHLRDVALLAIGNRVMRRLALPALAAATARRHADPAMAAAQALRDVEEVKRGISGTLCAIVLDAVLVPVLLLLLAWVHWGFAVLALTGASAALLLGVATERLTRGALAESNLASARGTVLVADAVRCAEAVEAMGILPSLMHRWAAQVARSAGRLRAAQAGIRITSTVTVVLYSLVTSGALVVGVLLMLAGTDIGYGMLAGLMLMANVMEPFGRFSGALEELATARAAWGRLDRLLREADAAPPADSHAYPCPEGRLSVERVTLVHPGSNRALLREVSFTIGPGDVVALIGAPGSGKSTLLRIMLGLQAPSAGSVFLDGHATVHWDHVDLARHVGYLPQDPAVQGGTVAEAIARLEVRPDMRTVLRAARLAGAEQMIASLPAGFATPLDGTVRLSMGQRQRIALARTVFGTPRILLLDEPAAYLDEAGEAAVLRMIEALSQAGTAVVLTSQREGLLRAARRVLTLQDGQLSRPGGQAIPARIAVAV